MVCNTNSHTRNCFAVGFGSLSVETKLEWLREQGFNEDHLGILVEDQKCQSATRINAKGMELQLRYLLTCLKWEEIVSSVQHERKMLTSLGMKSQSKLIPEKNVSAHSRRRSRKN